MHKLDYANKGFQKGKNGDNILRENAFALVSIRIIASMVKRCTDRTRKWTKATKNDLKGVENDPAVNELPK